MSFNRRNFLKALGATVAIPFVEIPSFAAVPPTRLRGVLLRNTTTRMRTGEMLYAGQSIWHISVPAGGETTYLFDHYLKGLAERQDILTKFSFAGPRGLEVTPILT